MSDLKEGPGLPRPRQRYADPVHHPLREVAAGLPRTPGVYLFKDRQGKVLYVGKALRLRDRVRSYFGAGRPGTYHEEMVGGLLTLARRLDHVVVSNEREALVLEASLIQLHRPAFNVRFNDDKRYPYLKLSRHRYPRVEVVRRLRDDGALYFGPFTDMKVRQTTRLLRALFGLRDCRKLPDKACLNYHIGMCSAPCIGAVDKDSYGESVRQAAAFLKGRNRPARENLRRLMQAAADRRHYERAADLRDHLARLELLGEGQAALLQTTTQADAMALQVDTGDVVVLHVRERRLLGHSRFQLLATQGHPPETVLAHFLVQFYAGNEVPPLLLLPFQPADRETISGWLSEQRGSKVILRVPRRGEKRRLLALARENLLGRGGRTGPPDLLVRGLEGELPKTLVGLQAALELPTYPQLIEGFDVSTLQGSHTVGARVTFHLGLPDRSHYRRYRLRRLKGQDDYAGLREMLERRFQASARRDGKEQGDELEDGRLAPSDGEAALGSVSVPRSGTSKLPDWLLIDGGAGQLSAAAAALRRVGLEPGRDLQLLSLAKREELLYLHGRDQPVRLDRRDPGLRLLQRVRDEAHRFGLRYHRNLRSRALRDSALEELEGVGPRRAAQLLRAFGSLEGVRRASEEQVATLPGWGPRTASRLKQALD